MNRGLIIMGMALMIGCMPDLSPSNGKSVIYEFDLDAQKWTQRDCTSKTLQHQEVQTVCYKQTISAPPGRVETTKGNMRAKAALKRA